MLACGALLVQVVCYLAVYRDVTPIPAASLGLAVLMPLMIVLEALDGRWRFLGLRRRGLILACYWRPPRFVAWCGLALHQGQAGPVLSTPLGSLHLPSTVVDYAGLREALQASCPCLNDGDTVGCGRETVRGWMDARPARFALLAPLAVLWTAAYFHEMLYLQGFRLRAVLLDVLVATVATWVATCLYTRLPVQFDRASLEFGLRGRVRSLALADLAVVRETTHHLYLRCGLTRLRAPLRNAAERRFALQVKEAITAAKRRLAESEVVL